MNDSFWPEGHQALKEEICKKYDSEIRDLNEQISKCKDESEIDRLKSKIELAENTLRQELAESDFNSY